MQLKKDVPDKFEQTAVGRLVQTQQTNAGLTRVTYRLRAQQEDIDPYWTVFMDGGMALFLPDCQVTVHGKEVSFVVDLPVDHFASADRLVELKRGHHTDAVREPRPSRPTPGTTIQQRRSGAGPSSSSSPVEPTSSGDADPFWFCDNDVHAVAAAGVGGNGQKLPHLDRIQRSFGHHDVSNVDAHVGGKAQVASEAMGAEAYATGSKVAFRAQPDLHTAAHEAAHVVQQRAGVALSGGVGSAGDSYEQHADAVADAVVAGKSAELVLDEMAGAASPGKGVVQKSETLDGDRSLRPSEYWIPFPETDVSSISDPHPLQILNSGERDESLDSEGVQGDVGDFYVDGLDDSILLRPGTDAVVDVDFQPTAPGKRSAVWRFGTGEAAVDVTFFGTGRASATTSNNAARNPGATGESGRSLELSTTLVDVGAVPVGTISDSQPVTVTNTGEVDETLEVLSIYGDHGEFHITGAEGQVLAAKGGSATLTIACEPRAPNARVATWQVGRGPARRVLMTQGVGVRETPRATEGGEQGRGSDAVDRDTATPSPVPVSDRSVANTDVVGKADATKRPDPDDLERDLKGFNNQWHGSVLQGIDDFTDDALEDRINRMGSGDWESFLFTIVGGLIGAAGSLASEGAAFALGLASVGVSAPASAPKAPSTDKSVTTAKDLLQESAHAVWNARNTDVDRVVGELLSSPKLKDAGRDTLLWAFLGDNFAPGTYGWDGSGPKLNPEVIQENAFEGAKDLFARWQKEVQPIGEVSSLGDEFDSNVMVWTKMRLGFILVPERPYQGRPALIEEVQIVTPGASRTKYSFVRWISHDLEEAASMRYYSTGEDRLMLNPDDLENMPA